MNIIRMHRMEFNASHGCYAEELTMKQKFIVNIDIYTDFSTAATEDRLDKTINYVDVYKLCEEIMLGDSVALIEHLSYKIGKALKQSFNTILKLKIEIQKRDVQLGGKLDYVSVIWEA